MQGDHQMSTSSPKEQQFSDPASLKYEDAIAALEKIISNIEEGTIGLEDSIAAYRHGTALIKRCRDILDHAEQEIEMLQSEENGSTIAPSGDDE